MKSVSTSAVSRAVCLAAASQQQASAWCTSSSASGSNSRISSGNDCGPCGLWHNGQVPAGWAWACPGCDGGAPYAGMMQQPGYGYAGVTSRL